MSEHDVDETTDGPDEAPPQSPALDEPRSNGTPPVLRAAKLDRPGAAKKKADKLAKAVKPDRADRPEKADRPDKAGRPDKAERADKPGKAGKKAADTDQDTEHAVAPPEAAASRRSVITWPRVLVAAVLAGVLVVCALLGARVIHDRRINAARASAMSAAQQYAIDFGTYDYKNLDASFARIANDLTGTFKDTYSRTAASLKATVIQYQEQATASVQGAGVTSVSPHRAVVIVLFDQSVRSINSTTPVINRTRASITLVRSGGGRWLMSALDLK